MNMRHSYNLTKLVQQFEGLRFRAYQDQVGVWTNGYGNTHGVTSSTAPITQAEATTDLNRNLDACDDSVNRLTNTLKLSQNEFDALVDFAFNLGSGRLAGSTLLNFLRSGNKSAAANEFLKWNMAGGVPNAGLTRRRQAERDLFLQP